MTAPEKQYMVRQFTANDVEQYKSMRLEALQLERGMFSNSYEYEAGFPLDQWVARVCNPAGACFGLYYGDEMIGITGIVVADDNEPGEAYMTQSYIRKVYRGKGLSRMLYDVRFEWARAHGITSLKIGHRAGNLVSKSANQHHGFVYAYSETRTWPDGGTEDMLYYTLRLNQA